MTQERPEISKENPLILILYEITTSIHSLSALDLLEEIKEIQVYYRKLGKDPYIFIEVIVRNSGTTVRYSYYRLKLTDSSISISAIPFFDNVTGSIVFGLEEEQFEVYTSYQDWKVDHGLHRTLTLIKNRTQYENMSN